MLSPQLVAADPPLAALRSVALCCRRGAASAPLAADSPLALLMPVLQCSRRRSEAVSPPEAAWSARFSMTGTASSSHMLLVCWAKRATSSGTSVATARPAGVDT
jgi:hypothetical protein